MSLFSWLWSNLRVLLQSLGLLNKSGKILFLGLDNAGKTTLFDLLSSGKIAIHAFRINLTADLYVNILDTCFA